MSLKNAYPAIVSGLFASCGSVFGKLCGLPSLEGHYIFKIVLFGCMIIFNSAGLTFFAKALQCSDSLRTTVISFAVNYSFSAVTGYIFFQEVTSTFWWSGLFFILTGLILVVRTIQNEEIKTD